MNKKTINLIAILNFFPNFLLASVALESTKALFLSGRNEREEQLKHLQGDYETLRAINQEQLKLVQKHLDQSNRDINEIKNLLKNTDTKDTDYLNKKLSIFNEMNQILFNIQFFIKEIISTVEQNIKLLEDYKNDPGFNALSIEPRSYYTFSAVKDINRRLLYQEDNLNQMLAQKNDALIELDNRKKKLATVTKEHADKKKAQEEFSAKNLLLKQNGQTELSFTQQGELLDLESKLANYEKQLASLKVQEITKRIALINTKIFLEQEKLKILKENLEQAKTGLRVLESELQQTKEKLDKKKQESLAIRDIRYDEIKTLSAQKEKLKKELDILNKKYGIHVGREITSWNTEVKTVESYGTTIDIKHKNQQIQLLERKIDYLRAQIDLEEGNFNREEINNAILNVWYKIKQRRFKSNTEIANEIKKFKEIQEEASRESTLFQDKRNASTALLAIENKELVNLKTFTTEIENEKEGLFKKYPTRHIILTNRLHESEKLITEQIENNSKLIEVYSSLIATFDETIKELSFVLNELETKSIWQRSEYAISWQGVKNILPDLIYFLMDLRQITSTYLMHTNRANFAKSISLWQNPGRLFTVLLSLLILFALIFLFKKWIFPKLRTFFLTTQSRENNFNFSIKQIFGFIILFIEKHLKSLFIWTICFFAIYFELCNELFLRLIFYMLSIPYLSYLALNFSRMFVVFNKERNYAFFSQHFEKRFNIVFGLFAYVSIVILCFREAFILTTIHKSELPTILLATYSIFLRTLIIFSIGKEEILILISHRGGFWSLISPYVEKYYYVLLVSIIAIMIVSDPYVGGYGNLVSYILWGAIGTLAVFKIFLGLYQYCKRISGPIFFDTDEEVIRERFGSAKTAYGLFIIVSFLLLAMVGIFIAIKLWHIPLSLQDIIQVFYIQLFDTGFDKNTGQVIWFTPLKFVIVLAFIFGGFFISIIINRYFLRFIFDLLPVDLGIQNTIVSITRYFILVIAIYLGFQWAGLGTLLLAIGVVIGSIGYIVKEPIGDFISYFIILVQRPIQIGDYIFLDEENQGVVRKITPRSVILRRKDSYTIIIPNSMLLNRPINNWNYARNFIAFDDIEFTVPFTVDPARVKALVFEILDHNTDILKSPRPIIRLHEFGESGFIFKVRGFLSDRNIPRKWDIASDVRFSIAKTLREQNIAIAVPTRLILTRE